MKAIFFAALMLAFAIEAQGQSPSEPNTSPDNCKHSDTPACKQERERRCTTAIDSFIDQAARIDREAPTPDAARARLVAAFRQRAQENRRSGVEECRTWGELSGMAAGQ